MEYNHLEDVIPPIVPENEQRLAEDPVFSAHCRSMFELGDSVGKRAFGKPVLSRNPKWGLVWRADFRYKDHDPPYGLINRAMCWRKADGSEGVVVADAQAIPPLWPEEAGA